MNSRNRIIKVLQGEVPDRVPFSPNIWQWFNHHKFHGTLPSELSGCETLADAHLAMGEDCFSRNLATDHRTKWYGGFTKARYEGVEVETVEDGCNIEINYHTSAGDLRERFMFEENSTTLIQRGFVFSMSCNTAINTSYDVIRWFGDATRELSKELF